jgi:hypothetical protein
MIPSESGPQLLTQCGTEIQAQGALSDEKGNIYVYGMLLQSLADPLDEKGFHQIEMLSVALLHDHDLDLFSDQSKVKEDACSFRGVWQWHDKDLPIEPIYSAELSQRFQFIKAPSN